MAARVTGTAGGLRLIRGGLHRETRYRGLRIVAAPERRPPFPVDAVTHEEDTFLVLSAETTVHQPVEHPIRLMTGLWDAKPEPPGSVRVSRGRPLQFLAVVHDLSADPTWKSEWVSRAFARVLEESEARGLASVGLPLLGCCHGTLAPERCLRLLRGALRKASLEALRRLWLILPKDADGDELLSRLEGSAGRDRGGRAAP